MGFEITTFAILVQCSANRAMIRHTVGSTGQLLGSFVSVKDSMIEMNLHVKCRLETNERLDPCT